MMKGWYNLVDGEPVPVPPGEFPGLQPDSVRRVGLTEFPNGASVSTVFLGLDHNWRDGPPVLWETMIFWNDHELDNDRERYTSLADAQAGHEVMVERVNAAMSHAEPIPPPTPGRVSGGGTE